MSKEGPIVGIVRTLQVRYRARLNEAWRTLGPSEYTVDDKTGVIRLTFTPPKKSAVYVTSSLAEAIQP